MAAFGSFLGLNPVESCPWMWAPAPTHSPSPRSRPDFGVGAAPGAPLVLCHPLSHSPLASLLGVQDGDSSVTSPVEGRVGQGRCWCQQWGDACNRGWMGPLTPWPPTPNPCLPGRVRPGALGALVVLPMSLLPTAHGSGPTCGGHIGLQWDKRYSPAEPCGNGDSHVTGLGTPAGRGD